MGGCSSCKRGLRSLIGRKLGRCPRCMRASTSGTMIGWVASAAVYVLWPNPALLALSAVIAAGFTLLLLAHLVAFTARTMTLWETLHASAPSEVQQLWPSRRVFLMSLLGAAAAAFLPPVLSRRAERAGDTQLVQVAEVLAQGYADCEEIAVFSIATGVDFSRRVARQKLDADAIRICEEKCRPLRCPGSLPCDLVGEPVFGKKAGKPHCERFPDSKLWICTGTVRSCPCNCTD
jgi:hypothetical protein